MVTLFGIFETGSRGLASQQVGLAVTGNNIANVNTPGYSRQRANLVTTPDIDIMPKPLGTGVTVNMIQRFRSEFLDTQIRLEKSNQGYYQSMADTYGQMETIFADPITLPASSLEDTAEAGLNASMIRFFDSLHELSLEPESTAVRSAVREQAITLAETFNTLDQQLQDLRADVNRQIEGAVGEVNAILDALLEVNIQIARLEIEEGANANNLRDERDRLISDLSEYVPVKVTRLDSGAVNIEIFGINAVQPSSVTHMVAELRPRDPNLYRDIIFEDSGGQVLNNQMDTGKLGALIQARDTVVPAFQEDIDELANTLIYEINKLHSGGSGLKGYSTISSTNGVQDAADVFNGAGLDFPVTSGSFDIVMRDTNGDVTATYTINVDPAVDSVNSLAAAIDSADGTVGGGDLTTSVNARNEIQIDAASGLTFTFESDSSGVLAALGINTFFEGSDAASMSLNRYIRDDLALIAASADGAPGNNEVALDMAQLRHSRVFLSNTADFNQFYQGTIAELGTQGRRVAQLESSTSLLVDSLETRQEEIAGVSLDEETVNMLKFQRAFVASSRFITTIDELIEAVVERLGLVGR